MLQSRAAFAASVSHPYALMISRAESKYRKGQWPAGLTKNDLDILNPKSRLFHTPIQLISAGQYLRHRLDHYPVPSGVGGITTIGDSGGFQIIENPDWYQGQQTVLDVLAWQETHCDVAPILDIPTGCIAAENPVFDEVRKCLDTTLNNIRWAVDARRSSKLFLLNVAQGRDLASAQHWYKAVRPYKLQGWAFGGITRTDLEVLLRLLIRMRDDGELVRVQWIHMFGVATIAAALAYTSVRRSLEALVGRSVPVSFDVSTPYSTVYQFRSINALPKVSANELALP